MGVVSLREQNKSDKQRRIQEAARHLFSTRGFDATSTRDIADRARVGLATLFLYAADKRDLLRELTFYTSGQQSERFQATRRATIASVARIVSQARKQNAVRCSSSDADIAEVIFYVFAAAKRIWTGGLVQLQEYVAGMARLHIHYKTATWLRGLISNPFMRAPMPRPRQEEIETLYKLLQGAGMAVIDHSELKRAA